MALNKNISGSNIINHQSRGVTLFKLNEAKYRRNRKILPGFPKTNKFETIEEIELYFEGQKIQCLLCGRKLMALGHHLTKIHSMTNIEYKLRYGLPMNKGLTSSEFHKENSEMQKNLYKAGVNPLSKKKNRLKGSRAAKKVAKNRHLDQPFNKKRQSNTHKYSSSVYPKYTEEQIKAIEERAKAEDRTIKNVCLDKDMPSAYVYYKYKRGTYKK